MVRPTNRKKRNLQNFQEFLSAKRQRLEAAEAELSDPPSPSPPLFNATPNTQPRQAPNEVESVYLSEPKASSDVIEPLEVTNSTHPTNVVAPIPEIMLVVGLNDQVSLPDAPDEPEATDPDEIQANNPLNPPASSCDVLIDEAAALQNSIAAVAVPFQNAPIPRDVAVCALKKLNLILRPSKEAPPGYNPPRLDSMYSVRRLGAMAACLNYYCNKNLGWSLTYSSEIAALGAGYGTRYGRNIRRLIRSFINTDNLPENQYGTWNASVMEDEDLATELKDYLVECRGRYARAQDIIEYLERPDVKQRFKLDEPPSLRTAQRWMKEFGFRWGMDPKGQYVDGHEREDVVQYRNERYIPIWSDIEKRMYWYESTTMEKFVPVLGPGERMVMDAKPYAKGEGASIMVADFVGIDGWLCGEDPSENARVVLFPGKTRDGYLTGERVRQQFIKAINIAQKKYPDAEHVFVYDNATTHTKRREDLANISKMTLGPSSNIGDVIEERTDENGAIVKVRVRFEDTHFPDGSPQCLYYPDDHPKYGIKATGGVCGQFKGIAQILCERKIDPTGLKLVLAEQPGFAEQQSALEEIAEAHGCRLLFLPKFHCELNPIEQCWGYAKRVYRQFPPSKSQAALKSNMLASLDSVPVESIRRFFNKAHRYLDAYRQGLDGQQAAWANKKYRSHRVLPPSILQEIEVEFHRNSQHRHVVRSS